MLRKGQYGLQGKNGDGWQWVFCHCENTGAIVFTDNPRKALPAGNGDPGCIAYFQRKHGNIEFREQKIN